MTDKIQGTDMEKTAKRYDDFVRQIQILDVFLVTARINNLVGGDRVGDVRIRVNEKTWYENTGSEVVVYVRYNVTARNTETREAVGRISVTFAIRYSSAIQLTDEAFEVFRERNVTINAWPYLREFIHSMATRMGWAGMIAPVRKVYAVRD